MRLLRLVAARLKPPLAIVLLAWLLAPSPPAAAAADTFVELRRAERSTAQGTQTVTLPDSPVLPAGADAPLRATYRLDFQLEGPLTRMAMCLPGLIAHARIRVNSHLVFDRLDDPMAPLPRGSERLRFIEVPQEFVRLGHNDIEIEIAAPRSASVSQLFVGQPGLLEQRYARRLFGVITGPAIVAMVVASLALCVLLLWARRGDALYGYFGIGSLGWALHTLWTISPVVILSGVHRDVWWTSLYSLFVVMLVIFCVRFAGWRWPRFDRTLIVAAVSAPLVMYTASAFGEFARVQELWLLACIVAVVVALVAVGRYVWANRNTSSVLLVLTGVVSSAFAINDWLVSHRGQDNNPIYLVPYAGLLFVVLVAWMLIDRFVTASRELETMNLHLEQRVAAKNAELTLALQSMRSVKDHAEAANRSKTAFLAAASHDLRQPIHALGLYMEALGDEPLAGAARDLVQRMKMSLRAMASMFNALLDISRMDTGALQPKLGVFRIDTVLQRLAAEFATSAEHKGLRLSLALSPQCRRLNARSDPVLFERIVRNLLANAVQYTATGGVLLSCRLRQGDRWRVEVWDTGIGLAPHEHERVFEEFYQVGNPERDRNAGLGLGLSIVQRLCKLLDHPLEMSSRAGRGTRFSLQLPSTAEAAAVEESSAAGQSVSGLVVAVIDDDAEVLDSMQRLLQRWGCRVLAAGDAEGVLAQAGARTDVRAVIADYRLRGGRTGTEAIAILRAAVGSDLPALIVSGDSLPQQEQEHRLLAGGHECLRKPLSAPQLRAWLAQAARTVPPAPPHEESTP
jgi:signal transduction histidine kinase/CheY-like chemotaxis protein